MWFVESCGYLYHGRRRIYAGCRSNALHSRTAVLPTFRYSFLPRHYRRTATGRHWCPVRNNVMAAAFPPSRPVTARSSATHAHTLPYAGPTNDVVAVQTRASYRRRRRRVFDEFFSRSLVLFLSISLSHPNVSCFGHRTRVSPTPSATS